MNLIFDSATAADVAEVVALVQSAYRGESSRQGWTTEADLIEGQRVDAEMVDELILDQNSIVMTVRGDDGGLVGCCELRFRPERDEVYLGMFAVSPSVQASGIGRRILDEAEQIATENWNATRMTISVIENRSELIAWYGRRGYELTGETADFPYGDERFGVPRRHDLRFVILAKAIG